jgi:hypothetical protein
VKEARAAQYRQMAQRLAKEGIPGEIVAQRESGADAAMLLYRPGGDWARALQPGDPVRVAVGSAPVDATVRKVQPWGEKTRLAVAFAGSPPALRQRQPARLFLAQLSETLPQLPAGLGRSRSKEERIDWLLSSIYCTCGQGPDSCTGHLYTLIMCHPKSCPMPAMVREKLGALIDQGKSDAEVIAQLEKEQGPLVRQIHLRK